MSKYRITELDCLEARDWIQFSAAPDLQWSRTWRIRLVSLVHDPELLIRRGRKRGGCTFRIEVYSSGDLLPLLLVSHAFCRVKVLLFQLERIGIFSISRLSKDRVQKRSVQKGEYLVCREFLLSFFVELFNLLLGLVLPDLFLHIKLGQFSF